MEIFALFMLCGIATTLLIPETKRKTLEELAGEVEGTPNYDPVTAGHETIHGEPRFRDENSDPGSGSGHGLVETKV